MLTEQEREARRKSLGGSDASASCGMSAWTTMYELWEDKLGLRETQQNEAMRWGSKLEPLIRDEYEHVTGFHVLQPVMFRSVLYPWAHVNVDGQIDDELILECKSARSSDGWGEPGTDQIPDDYTFQCQHTMAVMPLVKRVDVAVLFPFNRFEIYSVYRDDKFIDDLMIGEKAFWNYVQTETPPPVATIDDCRKRWSHALRGETIEANDEILSTVHQLDYVKKEMKHLKDTEDECKFNIIKYMEDNDTLIDADGVPLVTYRETKPSQLFDATKFQAAHPKLYAEFLGKPKTQRRLLVK